MQVAVSRSTLYYKGVDESEQNLRLMTTMDRLFTEDPTLGVLGMQDELVDMVIQYNIKRIRRLLHKMGVVKYSPIVGSPVGSNHYTRIFEVYAVFKSLVQQRGV